MPDVDVITHHPRRKANPPPRLQRLLRSIIQGPMHHLWHQERYHQGREERHRPRRMQQRREQMRWEMISYDLIIRGQYISDVPPSKFRLFQHSHSFSELKIPTKLPNSRYLLYHRNAINIQRVAVPCEHQGPKSNIAL